MAEMEWRSSQEWFSQSGIEIKTELDIVFREYYHAVEAFALGVTRPSSVYDLMVVKQRYLLAAAAVLKSVSDIFAYRDVSLAASLFEAAAWAYLDNSDLQAQLRGLDNRFAPAEENLRPLRSRLKVIAERVDRIGILYRKEIQETPTSRLQHCDFFLTWSWNCP
jgi:hypothetical protein